MNGAEQRESFPMPLHHTARSIPRSHSPPATGKPTAIPAEIETALGKSSPRSLQALLQQAHRVHYAPQDVLFHAASENDNLLFITEGLSKLVTYLPSGRVRIVRLHRPGQVLGLGALRGRNHQHTAIAVTHVVALRLPVAAVLRLRTEDPHAYAGLLERWHDYLHEADTWITEFSTGPIRGRVARLLAFLMEFDTCVPEDQVQLLTCEEMGAILGVTSESTSRILAEFKRQGILAAPQEHGSERYQADSRRLRAIGDNE
jgi:CRP-like cAMP-binding protein